MDIVYGNEITIEIDLRKFHNVTDVAYVVKADAADTDNDAKLFKTVTGSTITDNNNGKFDVPFLDTDFAVDKLVAGQTYSVYVGIKYANSTNFIEVDVGDTELTILADGIRG